MTNFDAGAIGNGGIVASETGLVKKANGGTPTADNEWRNGALTLWAAEVTNVVASGSTIAYDATYTLDKSHSTNTNIITGITDADTSASDTSQALLWEQTTFWHRGANNTAPGDADYYFDADVNNVVLTTSPLGDIVSITKSLKGNSVLNMNEGDDLLEVRDVKEDAEIIMGGGDDTIIVFKELNTGGLIDMGAGDDTLDVAKIKNSSAAITMGDGDDTVTVDVLGNFTGTADGGIGNDQLTLSDVSISHWSAGGVDAKFTNFERVTLSDSKIILDISDGNNNGILTGDTDGFDTFFIQSGDHTINNFDALSDTLDLSDLIDIDDGKTLENYLTVADNGGKVQVNILDNSGVATSDSVTIEALTYSNTSVTNLLNTINVVVDGELS